MGLRIPGPATGDHGQVFPTFSTFHVHPWSVHVYWTITTIPYHMCWEHIVSTPGAILFLRSLIAASSTSHGLLRNSSNFTCAPVLPEHDGIGP